MSLGIWNEDGSLTLVKDAAHMVRLLRAEGHGIDCVCVCGREMTGEEARGRGRPVWSLKRAGSRPVCSAACAGVYRRIRRDAEMAAEFG